MIFKKWNNKLLKLLAHYEGQIDFPEDEVPKNTDKKVISQVIDLTKEIVNSVSIPVIASGGCGKPEDMITVFKETDVEAALAASIFHYETHSVDRVKKIIKENGIPVRI